MSTALHTQSRYLERLRAMIRTATPAELLSVRATVTHRAACYPSRQQQTAAAALRLLDAEVLHHG
jgi:predicted component of type VI protein secretion system